MKNCENFIAANLKCGFCYRDNILPDGGTDCRNVLFSQIIAECVERLDVALLNGILRNPENNFPSDPFADPIMDLSVLPIPIGALSFGAGSQLKNVVSSFTNSDFQISNPV
jgi:hypothetical protein